MRFLGDGRPPLNRVRGPLPLGTNDADAGLLVILGYTTPFRFTPACVVPYN